MAKNSSAQKSSPQLKLKISVLPLLQAKYQALKRAWSGIPQQASADAGYFSKESITAESLSSVELFVPPDRETHPRTILLSVGRIPKDISPADRMRRKLSTTSGKEIYSQRKCIVEPVFGQVKESVLEFDRFSWRGLANVRNQWALVCTAHNLVKLHRAWQKAGKQAQQLPEAS